MSTEEQAPEHGRPRCGANTDHGPCRLPAGWGTQHKGIGSCRKHGGNTRNHQTAAERAKARLTVAEFAARSDIDPTEAMLEVLGIRRGMVLFLTEKVASMESDDELKQWDAKDKFERPSVWVEMLETSMREYGRAAKACVDAGIQERQMRIAEAHGRALDGVIRRIIEGIFAGLVETGVRADQLEAFQRERLPGIVRSSLSALTFRAPDELPRGA